MRNTADDRPNRVRLPGSSASGAASAAQMIAGTATFTFVEQSAAPVNVWAQVTADYWAMVPFDPAQPLNATDYPTLAAIWDNDEDDVFDNL